MPSPPSLRRNISIKYKPKGETTLKSIDDKGKQTLASIPEDYTALTKKVDELTQRIESLEKV